MADLTIAYDPPTRSAVLTVVGDTPAWPKISRACYEHSDQVSLLAVQSLSLPWWQFLSCREAVGYYASRYNLGITFEEKAEQLLRRAEKKRESFSNFSTEIIPENEIQRRLEEKGFTRILTDQQIRNVSSLSGAYSGATFSVPGAGKTTEALALFFLRAPPDSRLLVIAPKNAFAAWERELALCVPSSDRKFERLVGGEERIKGILRGDHKPHFMLVTYHQLQYARDPIASELSEDTWLFLDESHRIKRGLEGKIGNTVLSISHIPNNKLILSGTPMPNSVGDLVPQFEFLFPEVIANEDNVAELIQPHYVRTTKSELGLRPPDRYLVPVPMSDAQRCLYQLVRSETARMASSLQLRDRSRLRALGRSAIRLLQLVSNPALVAKSGDLPEDLVAEILAEDSPKIQFACDRARDLVMKGKKVVIWTTFVENVELISRRLGDLGADYIHGGVDAGNEEEEDTREWKIRKFHEEGKNWVLVANPAACGEGISLHEICHHALYVDRNYNAAQYLQSEDRIHRLGLKANQRTIVEILICPDSIDESVDQRLKNKVQRMAAVLNDKDLHIDPVSFEPSEIDNDETMDEGDAQSLLQHVGAEEIA